MLDRSKKFSSNISKNISAGKLCYSEGEFEFNFFVEIEYGKYVLLDTGEEVIPRGEITKIFQPVSVTEKTLMVFSPIKSLILHGVKERKINSFMLKDAALIDKSKNIYALKEDAAFDYDKLIKIEDKINQIKNLEGKSL